MADGDRGPAIHYHDATKHSFESVRTTPHFLDWANQPRPFKLYRDLEPIDLPPIGEPSDAPAERLDVRALARILFHAAGVTKRRRFPGGEMLFRAAACTGALYHVEIYVVTGEIDGLPAGTYHYGPKDHALVRLRASDGRGALVAATGSEPALSRARVALVLTTTFWRNAWKYRARAYRHAYWDSGTILSHVEAMAATLRVPARFILGFADDDVNALIGVDGENEAAVAVVALGRGEPTVPSTEPSDTIDPEVVPLSPAEVVYPLIGDTHRGTALADGEAVARWRRSPDANRDPNRPTVAQLPDVESVIRRRGSSRRFARVSTTVEDAMAVLSVTAPAVSMDAPPLCDVYVIVNAVDGIAPGAYYYERRDASLTCLKAGEFRREARYLDLEQDLAGDASVNVYMLATLDDVVASLGERGYRAAQLEGGMLGGRMYLATYARGLGATGLTFFDDAVVDFFSPHARGKAVMFLLAFGRPAKRAVLYER